MHRRLLLCCALGLATVLPGSGLALAQETIPAAVPSTPAVRVAIETSIGTILVETDPRAPVTSANFLRYVDEHRLDGTTFYRGMVLGAGTGLIQGGTSNDPDRVLPPIAHEPTSQTGLSHTDGVLSMARFDPGTANGDFFIIVGNVSGLDAGRAAFVGPAGLLRVPMTTSRFSVTGGVFATSTTNTKCLRPSGMMAFSGIPTPSRGFFKRLTVIKRPGFKAPSGFGIMARTTTERVASSIWESMAETSPLNSPSKPEALATIVVPTFRVCKNTDGTEKSSFITESSSSVVITVAGCNNAPTEILRNPKIPSNGAVMMWSSRREASAAKPARADVASR
jgi:peptidyl-prolyl cis-trans isomerase A (cyclophilin A)